MNNQKYNNMTEALKQAIAVSTKIIIRNFTVIRFDSLNFNPNERFFFLLRYRIVIKRTYFTKANEYY